jgi:hypothetical protein
MSSAAPPTLTGETQDYTQEERDVWTQCVAAGLNEEEAKTVLSYTHILMMIRGFSSEKERVKVTTERVNQITQFKKKHRVEAKLAEANADADYFHANWDNRVYGQDAHGHHIFVERMQWYNISNLLTRFDTDEAMMSTRGILCEVIERIKGNTGVGKEDSFNPIYKHIHILDLQGLSFGHFSAGVRHVIQKVVIEMGNFYPDSVYKLFFVNAPFAFRAIWGMISPFVHPATLAKIKICGGGSGLLKEFNANYIPTSSVPDFLGGSHPGTTISIKMDEYRAESAKEGPSSGAAK